MTSDSIMCNKGLCNRCFGVILGSTGEAESPLYGRMGNNELQFDSKVNRQIVPLDGIPYVRLHAHTHTHTLLRAITARVPPSLSL